MNDAISRDPPRALLAGGAVAALGGLLLVVWVAIAVAGGAALPFGPPGGAWTRISSVVFLAAYVCVVIAFACLWLCTRSRLAKATGLLAGLGVILATVSVPARGFVVLTGLPSAPSGPPSAVELLVPVLGTYGMPAGALLVGLAVIGALGPSGAWRFLPLFVAVAMNPAVADLVFVAYTSLPLDLGGELPGYFAFVVLPAAAGAGCLALGYAVYSDRLGRVSEGG